MTDFEKIALKAAIMEGLGSLNEKNEIAEAVVAEITGNTGDKFDFFRELMDAREEYDDRSLKGFANEDGKHPQEISGHGAIVPDKLKDDDPRLQVWDQFDPQTNGDAADLYLARHGDPDAQKRCAMAHKSY